MKLSTVGIGLLTVMVAINSYLNEGYFTAQDGSFKNGITLDRSNVLTDISEMTATKNSSRNLYAFSSVSAIKFNTWMNYVSFKDKGDNLEEIEVVDKSDNPISVAQVNSLVVYDLNNPEKNVISTQYEDFVDDIPLDNTNTIVSGLMAIMPRK